MTTALFVIGCILIVFVGSAAGISTFWLLVISVIFAFFLIGKEDKNKKNTLKQLQEHSPNAIKYDAEKCEITLTERNKDHRKRFSFENYVSTRHGYAKEKLIFTSATVGGVTTGGWDKVGGYGTEKKKTDKYNLVYEYMDPKDNSLKKGYVKKILLSGALLEEAQKSDIKEYLKGNSIIVVTPLVSSEKEKEAYLNLHRISGGGYTTHLANLDEDDKIRTLPNIQKCSSIVNWISGNN